MTKFPNSGVNERVVLIVVCVVSGILGLALGGRSRATAGASPPSLPRQSDEKVIERYERPGEPFEFSDLHVRNSKIALRQTFSARSLAEKGGGQAEDWLENLEFKLKNKSDKRITFILLQLQFPETAANGPKMVYHLHVGIHPKPSVDELEHGKSLGVGPGDAVTFTVSAKELELIKQFLALRNFQLADLNKVLIRIVSVVFDDETKWEMDYYYRPNASAPGGFERINEINQ
jgi:hypothetical protein